ncbi:unnamed protein product [Calicophoron daubneyi]|uniref:DZF domain-containing protein n=1 Tax=Calicophoron daubneyi TaxID=300641 RepID=A0AAV2SWL4_CALDB
MSHYGPPSFGIKQPPEHSIYFPKNDPASSPGVLSYPRGGSLAPTGSLFSPPSSNYQSSSHSDGGYYTPNQQRQISNRSSGGSYSVNSNEPFSAYMYNNSGRSPSAMGDAADAGFGGFLNSTQMDKSDDNIPFGDTMQDSFQPYNIPSDYPRSRPPQTVYSSGPVRFMGGQSDLSLGGPRFRPRQPQFPFRPRLIKPPVLYRSRKADSDPMGMGIQPERAVNRERFLLNTGGRGNSSAYYCELCKLSCAGLVAFKQHQRGQRHQKRMIQNEAMEKLKKSDEAGNLKTVTNRGVQELRCELCNVGCTGAEAYSAHLAGKHHQRTLRLHRELGKPIPPTDNPLVSSEVAAAIESKRPTTEAETKEKVSPPSVASKPTPAEPVTKEAPKDSTDAGVEKQDAEVMKHVDLTKLTKPDKPVVGAEYIEQITGIASKSTHYRCKLCECQFTNADAKEVHLRGRRHRVQYKKKVDPTLEVESKSNNSLSRKTQNSQKKNETVEGPYTLGSTRVGPGPRPAGECPPFPPQQFPRYPYSPSGRFASAMQHPNLPAENRYIAVKHSQLVPTEIEAKAMKSVVSACEHSLKTISDDLVSSDKSEAEESADAREQDSNAEKLVDTEDVKFSSENEQRLLRGVVRVGLLGKSLLLRGDHVGELVLVCSHWPTSKMVEFIETEIVKTLRSMELRFTYEVTSKTKIGLITIVATRVNQPEVKSDKSEEPAEKIEDWPSITVHIQLTSPAVAAACEDETDTQGAAASAVPATSESGAVKADGSNGTPNAAPTASEQKSNKASENNESTPPPLASGSRSWQLATHGEPIAKHNCLEALEAINQAKWFQAALSKPPLGMVSRVLRDFMRADKYWSQLDEFAVLAYLDRLLTFDLQLLQRSAMVPRPPPYGAPPMMPQYGPPFISPVRGNVPPMTIGVPPAKLFRRFFEAIASGLLLLLKSPSTENPETIASSAEPNHQKIAYDEFFGFSVLANTALEVREKVTVSAQFILRQIAFKQLYKVLGMELFSAQFTENKIDSKGENAAEEVESGDSQTTSTEETQPPGTTHKRRRSGSDVLGDQEETAEPEEEPSCEKPVIKVEKSEPTEKAVPAQKLSPAPVPEQTPTVSPGVTTRYGAKRSRREVNGRR